MALVGFTNGQLSLPLQVFTPQEATNYYQSSVEKTTAIFQRMSFIFTLPPGIYPCGDFQITNLDHWEMSQEKAALFSALKKDDQEVRKEAFVSLGQYLSDPAVLNIFFAACTGSNLVNQEAAFSALEQALASDNTLFNLLFNACESPDFETQTAALAVIEGINARMPDGEALGALATTSISFLENVAVSNLQGLDVLLNAFQDPDLVIQQAVLTALNKSLSNHTVWEMFLMACEDGDQAAVEIVRKIVSNPPLLNLFLTIAQNHDSAAFLHLQNALANA